MTCTNTSFSSAGPDRDRPGRPRGATARPPLAARVDVGAGVKQDLEHFPASNVSDGRRVESANGVVDASFEWGVFVEEPPNGRRVTGAEGIVEQLKWVVGDFIRHQLILLCVRKNGGWTPVRGACQVSDRGQVRGTRSPSRRLRGTAAILQIHLPKALPIPQSITAAERGPNRRFLRRGDFIVRRTE